MTGAPRRGASGGASAGSRSDERRGPGGLDVGRARARGRGHRRRRGRRSSSATRTPTPTRSGRRSRSPRSSRPTAAGPRPSAPTRCRRCTPSCPASSGSGRDPGAGRGYDLLVIVDCGSLDRVGPVRDRHRRLFETLDRVVIDHHVSNAGDGPTDWIDPAAAATCEMVALLANRLGVPLDVGRRRAGDGADGRDRHGHRDVRPPQRDAADARRVGRARRGRRAAVRHLAPALPLEARRPAPAVRAGPRPARARRRRPGRLVDAHRRRPRRPPGPARSTRRGSSTCSPSRSRPRSRSCSRSRASATRISVRTKPGGVDATVLTGAFGGGGHARAAGATVDRPLDAARERGPRGGPPAGRPGRAVSPRGRRADAPGLDGILVVAKPAGPTSHDVVALVRRLAATRRVGHGGTLDPFATGVLPVFLGRATRLVEYHLGDRKALSGDDLLRRELDDRRPRRRADARSGRRRTARAAVEAALAGARRADPPGPAGLLGGQGRRPAGLRDGPGGRDARARAARGDDPRARPRRVGRRRPRPADRRRRGRLLGRDVRPLARPRPRASRRAAPPTSARSSGRRRAGSRSRTAHPLEAIRAAAADGPAGSPPLLLPIDAGLDRLARGRARASPRSPRSAAASSSVPRPACPALGDPDERVIAVDRRGRLVAVATIRDGRLAPDKVLVDAPHAAAVAVGDA